MLFLWRFISSTDVKIMLYLSGESVRTNWNPILAFFTESGSSQIMALSMGMEATLTCLAPLGLLMTIISLKRKK